MRQVQDLRMSERGFSCFGSSLPSHPLSLSILRPQAQVIRGPDIVSRSPQKAGDEKGPRRWTVAATWNVLLCGRIGSSSQARGRDLARPAGNKVKHPAFALLAALSSYRPTRKNC